MQPPEVFSVRLEDDRMRRLTRINRVATSVNLVQVHDVRFTLSNGESRSGHLIQGKCSLLDLAQEYETGYRGYIGYLVGAAFEDDPHQYFEKSPSEFAEDVKTPTLIFAGTQDFLPYQISEDFHDGIQAAATPADFYQFVGEGHTLSQFNSQIVAAQAQLLWFREYLKP